MAEQLLAEMSDEEFLVQADRIPFHNREHVDYLTFAIDQLRPLAGKRILEVGAGGGMLAVYLALQGADVTGIDVSAGILEVAAKRAEISGVADRTRFVHVPIEEFDDPSGSFDAVIGNNVVHHFERDLAMDNLARLIAPGGRATFCEPVLFVPEAVRTLRYSDPVAKRFPPHTHTPDERSLNQTDIAIVERYFGEVSWRPFQVLCRLQNFRELSDPDLEPARVHRPLDAATHPADPVADPDDRAHPRRPAAVLHDQQSRPSHASTTGNPPPGHALGEDPLMKLLITGSAGMLGTSIVPTLVAAGNEVVATDIDLTNPSPWGAKGPKIDWLDIRDRSAVRAAFDTVAPDFVLHLAAETSLEASDDDPDHAYLTNTIATRYIALECRNRDVPMTFISTAGVFDGTKESGPYTEFDAPNPINTYGATKFEAEKLVAGILEKYYIIRAGWMVGGGADKDHKFVARILSQVREGRTTIHAVGDKFGTPTYTYDFAHCLLGLMHSEVYGLYHMVCGGDGSRYDVAGRILEVLGRDDIELVEVGSEFFAEEFPSNRPRSEIMRNMALDLQGMNTMRPWPEALAEYLENHFADLLTSVRIGA